MRTPITVVAVAAVLGWPSLGLAQQDAEDSCPPGGWFCEEEGEVEGDVEAPDQYEREELEPVDYPEAEPQERDRKRPPVVVYTPAGEPPPKIVVVQPSTEAPPPPKKRKRRRFGINLRLQGVAMGKRDQAHEEAGMGGGGISFRFRPVPHFALDFGLDSFGGTDWNGYRRHEGAASVSGIVFFNPRNAVQFYMLGGLSASGADVDVEDDFGVVEKREYSYFGGQLGAGLEFRVSRLVSLNVDLVGFMRGRTDDAARDMPEFTDPETGRATNASGGGLMRGGITFYW